MSSCHPELVEGSKGSQFNHKYMKRSGAADLPIYGGAIPSWLFDRMTQLCLPVVESIVTDYGKQEFLRRLSNPFWFQSFGAVIGMDWNSSGVTTAVMAALKKSLNPNAKSLGLYVCGGKGKQSMKTPSELIIVGDKTGLDGNYLARCSKLSAKVDNTALQDGYQLYLHSFVVSNEGDWSVIQQGMKSDQSALARRYHWNSGNIKSFVEEPHAAICGENAGEILNLVDKNAQPTQEGIMNIAKEDVMKILQEIPYMKLPTYCDVRSNDVDLKRLGSVLWLAQETETNNFEDLLLLKGLGPALYNRWRWSVRSFTVHLPASLIPPAFRLLTAEKAASPSPFPRTFTTKPSVR